MRPALPLAITLTAFLITACSGGAPKADLDGPTTVVTVAAAASGVSTLGVPFVGGVPVVENVAVTISVLGGTEPVELSFTLVEGVYRYDPEGLITSIEFPFTGSVSVALPAGNTYAFETTGTDGDALWIVYGVTVTLVDFKTSSVLLALQTLIETAALDTASVVSAVVPGSRVDVFLEVFAPGGYAVPVSDYTVAYALPLEDGAITATSNLGARATAALEPGDDVFTLSANVTGWRNISGVATWVDGVEATFEAPFSISAGFGFDVSAPIVTIADVTSAMVGVAVAFTGTASDDVGVARVQLFEGPELVGSTDLLEYEIDGVAAITLEGTTWSTSWTPANVGSHTFTVVAVDGGGNVGQSSTSVAVEPFVATTLTFDYGSTPNATVTAGEPVIIQGSTLGEFNPSSVTINLLTEGYMLIEGVSTSGLVVDDGMWMVEWTAPVTTGAYVLYFTYCCEPFEEAYFNLTVE